MFRKGNQERDQLIYKIVSEFNLNVDNWEWKEVAQELYDMSKGEYDETPDACRKAYKRYLDKHTNTVKDVSPYAPFDREPIPIKLDKPKEKQFKSIQVNEDGTQISERRIAMSETDSKSPQFCLEAHGYDSKLWEVVSIKNNFWDMSDGDGGLITMYQSKLIAKPISSDRELTKNDVDEIVKNIKPLTNNIKLLKRNEKEDLALEIDIADYHIGSLSWHEEVGEDNDYKISFATIYRQVEQARKIIELYNVNKVYICFLGDFLQCDNVEGTTAKGTPVDTDSRSKKMVNKGMEIAMYIIENLAIAETEVIWIEGNHSRLVEYTLFQSLPYVYSHAKHIKFDVSPRIRKAFVYGDNLIGLHHGEMKKDQMFNWLQVEQREAWGLAKYAEQHSGHTHQEAVIEKGGIINRTNPTNKIQDAYEYENGWKSEKATIAYLWTKHDKLKGQFYLR